MKRLCLLAFAVTLAWLIGSHLSNEAAAILAGVFFGVAISIPILLLLFSALNDSRSQISEPPTSLLPETGNRKLETPPQINIWIITEPEKTQVPNPHRSILPSPQPRQLPPPSHS